MINYKIGLEIHINLLTNEKLFHRGKASDIAPFDRGLPGTMPSALNFSAIKKAVRLANLLKMRAHSRIHFDRKIYRYKDLPSGYQITQKRFPQFIKGHLDIKGKRYSIKAMHIENDAGRTVKSRAYFNRVNRSLVEITTDPVFTDFESVRLFLKTLQIKLKMHGISNAKMEEGDMRFDVNISAENSQRLEVKNINSVSNIKNIIEWLPKYVDSKAPLTLKYTPAGLEVMREKQDYLFVVEGDIPVYRLPKFTRYDDHMRNEDYLEMFSDIDHMIDAHSGPKIMELIGRYDPELILNLFKVNKRLIHLENLDELIRDVIDKSVTTDEIRNISEYNRRDIQQIDSRLLIEEMRSYADKYRDASEGNSNAQKSFIGILYKKFPRFSKYEIVNFVREHFKGR